MERIIMPPFYVYTVKFDQINSLKAAVCLGDSWCECGNSGLFLNLRITSRISLDHFQIWFFSFWKFKHNTLFEKKKQTKFSTFNCMKDTNLI